MSNQLQKDLQCQVCNKTFASTKSLNQHRVMHTGATYNCEICYKVFRYQSNLFEHMSLHTGSTPYECPFCEKACRLKGNLKKHLRTHVTTAEELEAAWSQFSSKKVSAPMGKRRKRDEKESMDETVEMDDSNAIDDSNVGGASDSQGIALVLKKKPSDIIEHKDIIEHNPDIRTMADLFEQAKSIAFDPFNCPICHSPFTTKTGCLLHCQYEHPNFNLEQFEHFCEKCIRLFDDEKSYKQHMEYHRRVEIFRKENPEDVETMMFEQADIDEITAEQQQFQNGTKN